MDEVQVCGKDEHIQLEIEPILVAENEESPQTEIDDAGNKKIDVEDVQIDVGESNTTPSCTDRLCCLSKCACLVSCCLAISHFLKMHSSLAEFGFQIFGLVMYIIDVVTDFLSGASIISGQEMDFEKFGNNNFTAYTKDVCNNLVDYSHPIWGSLNIALAWLPGATLVPPLIAYWAIDKVPIHWAEKCLISTTLVVLWPFIGLLLTLRQFNWVKKLTDKALYRWVDSSWMEFKPDYMKLVEGCIEAPLQLNLQLFIIVAGQHPGPIQILAIAVSLGSIILNVEIGNSFGEDLGLDMCPAILTKLKMLPMIITSMTFRCFSFVAMATLLRIYAIIPLVFIWLVAHNTFQKVGFNRSFFFNTCTVGFNCGTQLLSNIPGEIISVTVGPILLPAKKTYWFKKDVTRQDMAELELERRQWFFFDSIGSFFLHGLTLIIIILLFQTTSLLNENLSLCAFNVIQQNVPLCLGCILGLGLCNCMMTFIYFKC